MQTFLKGKRVGYWLSEKKIKKLNFLTFVDMCRYGPKYMNSCLWRCGEVMKIC